MWAIERPMIRAVAKKFGNYPVVGAEIGVEVGHNAHFILNVIPNIKKLYLIDIWEEMPDNHLHVCKMFEKTKNVKILKMASEEAAVAVIEQLHFCYIDADHTYGRVKEDIELWYPKMVKGGILGGHDWLSYKSVRKAVTDWALKNRYKVNIGMMVHSDWWIEKGDKVKGKD